MTPMFRHVSVVRKKKHWYANENGQQKEKEGTAQCMQMSGVMKAERKRSAHCGPDATAPCNRRRAKETAHLPVSYRAHLHIAVGPRLDALRPRARSSSCIRGDFPIRRLGPGMQMRWLRQSIPRTMTSQSNAGNLPECQPPPQAHTQKEADDGWFRRVHQSREGGTIKHHHPPTHPARSSGGNCRRRQRGVHQRQKKRNNQWRLVPSITWTILFICSRIGKSKRPNRGLRNGTERARHPVDPFDNETKQAQDNKDTNRHIDDANREHRDQATRQ